jgi:PilZ domain-containing protein
VSQTSVPPGMVKATSFGNRRAAVRYRCAPATIGKVVSADDHELQVACIVDLSLTGIGMQVPRSISAGRLIMIAIKSNDGTKTFDLSAKVIHCNAVPHDEWYLGCRLTTPLTPEELDDLL